MFPGLKLTLSTCLATIFMAATVLCTYNIDAAQTSFNLDIRAEVTSTCRINSVQDIDFGTLVSGTATEYQVQSLINYACTNGVRGDFSLDGGTTTGNVSDRAMQNSNGAQLKYQLYANKKHTRLWGDGSGASSTERSSPGRGVSRPWDTEIYAELLDSDLLGSESGAYSDIITLSFDF